jgi:predicted phage terminase large subunit-like protein
MPGNKTVIKWFTQTKNKIARILSNSTYCMEHIYFPEGWENRWSEFAESLLTYQRTGKNAHDDSADSITGVCEDITEGFSDWSGYQ